MAEQKASNFNLIIVVAIVAIVAIFALVVTQQRSATGQALSFGDAGGALGGPFLGGEQGKLPGCVTAEDCPNSCSSDQPRCSMVCLQRQCYCNCPLTPQ